MFDETVRQAEFNYERGLAAGREEATARIKELGKSEENYRALYQNEKEDADDMLANITRNAARIDALEEALRGLQNGTAHPSDPQLKGDQPCWCDSRGMFAQGPHDDKCLAALTALSNTASAAQDGE